MTGQDARSATIYDQLAHHQESEEWQYRDCLKELHIWAKRFTFQFKLQIPRLVIGVGDVRHGCYGCFRYGHNALGLRGEVTIDRRRLHDNLAEDLFWKVLGTLLHELLHGWQEARGKAGKGNYHNREFRRKAAELGLIVSSRGHTQYDPDSPFFRLLEEHGVRVPLLPQPTFEFSDRRPRGTSNLKLWVCGCPVRARVAVAQFNAQCLDCGCRFQRDAL